VMPALLSVLQSVIPEIPKSNVRPLLDLADADTKSWRLGAKLFGLFGVSAAIMVAVGIYAALALMVRQRTSELAVRMVLGATPGTVVRMIVRHAAILTASGWLLGATMVLLTRRFFDGLLFGVRSTEPTITAAVACLLCAVAALGCLLPGIRAARLDPSTALRG
jgi:ABC-type antimicrobial peptide transport system permease subunit